MTNEELIAKLTDSEVGKALGADVLGALTSTLTKAGDIEKKLKDAEAKAGRILSEKKEALDKLATIEADVETLKTSGLSEAEKIKAEYTKVLKRAEKAEADFNAVQAEYGKAKRTVALDKIANTVKFIPAVTPDAGRILLESSLAAVANLDDVEAVATVLNSFKEGYKSLIAADSQAAGGGTGRPGGGSGTQTQPGAKYEKMSPAEREKDMKTRGII